MELEDDDLLSPNHQNCSFLPDLAVYAESGKERFALDEVK